MGTGSGIALRWHQQEQQDSKDNDRRASGVANLATLFPHLAAFQTLSWQLRQSKATSDKTSYYFLAFGQNLGCYTSTF